MKKCFLSVLFSLSITLLIGQSSYVLSGKEKWTANDYDGALNDFTKAIQINPNDADAYVSRGSLKTYVFKNYQGALEDCNKALALNPTLILGYDCKAFILYQLGKYHEAIQVYSKSIELKPNGSSYGMRGIIKMNLKDYYGAIADFDLAISMNPDVSSLYDNRGYANLALQRFQNAINDFTKSIELNPNESRTAYSFRGDANFWIGKKEAACLDWSRAGELGDENAYNKINEGCN